MKKKYVSVILRLGVALAGIAYIAWSLVWVDVVVFPAGYTFGDGRVLADPVSMPVLSQTDGEYRVQLPTDWGGGSHAVMVDDTLASDERPQYKQGIVTTLKSADWRFMAIGLVLVGLIYPIQAWRWWLLMRCRGMVVPFGKAMRLVLVGLFFNFCMPGMTGGDVVKAYYAAKGSGQRGVAVMSVVFDRVAGMIGLVLLAALVGLLHLDHPLVRTITLCTWVGFAGVLVMAGIYFSSRTRRLLGVEHLLGRLSPNNPLVKLDAAAVAYRDHKRTVMVTVLLSLPVHIALVLAVTLAGYALGMTVPWRVMFSVLPVIFLAGSMPISYQGVGVMEGLGVAFLHGNMNQIFGMLLMLRLYFVFYAACSSLLVLRGNMSLHPPVDEDEAATIA